MTLDSITLCFITLFSLVCINAAAADTNPTPAPTPSPTPTITDLSCVSPGTIHFSISNADIKSVLVECDQEGNNTIRTMSITELNRTKVDVDGCTINTPVKLAFFNDKHNESYTSVIRNDKSLVKEIIATCNGHNITVNQSWNSSDVSNLVATKQTALALENAMKINVIGAGVDAGPIQTVSLSKIYTLNINGPENLYILVESCDAASDAGFKYDLVHLYVNRKPNADYGILKTFPSNTTNGTATSMVGFRLLDSPVVHIRCVVDVCNLADCPSLTTTTTTTTAPTPAATKAQKRAAAQAQPDLNAQNQPIRRRRNVDTTNRRATLSTSFRVESLAFSTNGSDGGIMSDRRNVLVAGLLLAMNFLFYR